MEGKRHFFIETPVAQVGQIARKIFALARFVDNRTDSKDHPSRTFRIICFGKARCALHRHRMRSILRADNTKPNYYLFRRNRKIDNWALLKCSGLLTDNLCSGLVLPNVSAQL